MPSFTVTSEQSAASNPLWELSTSVTLYFPQSISPCMPKPSLMWFYSPTSTNAEVRVSPSALLRAMTSYVPSSEGA